MRRERKSTVSHRTITEEPENQHEAAELKGTGLKAGKPQAVEEPAKPRKDHDRALNKSHSLTKGIGWHPARFHAPSYVQNKNTTPTMSLGFDAFKSGRNHSYLAKN